MGIMKHKIYDGYGYPIGTFPINLAQADKIKEGRYCKLNADKEIVFADKGKKGYLVVFPNRAPKRGFATRLGAFLVGPYHCYIDNETYDDSLSYAVGDLLTIGDEGKLINNGGAGAVAVATVTEIDRVSEEGKPCIGILSIEKCLCVTE